MLRRFSSRREKLAQSFLTGQLQGARAYDRIAGYFSSSVLEVAGEALESVSGPVRIVCNSDLNPMDVATAKAAQVAIRQEWCASAPESLPAPAHPRFVRLHDFLSSGKLRVKVLPFHRFGLLHGKAGVITRADGTRTSFLGSVNETREGWDIHYELLWEDDSDEAVRWVQEEFEALWGHPEAVNLPDFVITDIDRIVRRRVVPKVEAWKLDPEPAATAVELPVFRRENGLWEHQKYFVKLAFDAHRGPHGARFLVADQVGLGKTLELALAAQLMALWGDRPILVLAPKTLVRQWQSEIKTLLDMPSAVWDGHAWVDENGVRHPAAGPQGITKCPRRIGIMSYGLVFHKTECAEYLKDMPGGWECIIVDEAHRCRRKNLGKGREAEEADPNNLLAFLKEVGPHTRSLLLATATPVQMYPVEAWDLLDVLATGTDAVLGNPFSKWRQAGDALSVVVGDKALPADPKEAWGWMRNPLPPAGEGHDFEVLRNSLRVGDEVAIVPGDAAAEKFNDADWTRVKRISQRFARDHNPFIRHIIRRSREYLENHLDPETKEPWLKPVRVELLGEQDQDAIEMPAYMHDAYTEAEAFCKALGKRMAGSGFLKTLLLRRIGSSLAAGASTASRILGEWEHLDDEDEDDDEPEVASNLKSLTPIEQGHLEAFLKLLDVNQEQDPKFERVRELLIEDGWLKEGCIVFSQYFDSVDWLAQGLSALLPEEPIGMYAGSNRSGIWKGGTFERKARHDLKEMVQHDQIRLLIGTDAASEGLNLQRLGTLINLDLPWNPTRLEQRKGRIQRIGQVRDVVRVYNMRYRGSVEDRVHSLLSERLEGIFKLFGQLPDILEDAWVEVALGEVERAHQIIDSVPIKHPFDVRYHEQVARVPWESCAKVLDAVERRACLSKGWK